MSLTAYAKHYLQLNYILLMLLTAAGVIALCLLILRSAIQRMAGKYPPDVRNQFIREEGDSLVERFFELIFSATSILLFVGVYFLIDFLGIGAQHGFWQRYNSFILLGFILTSVLLNSLIDNLIIPLTSMKSGERASMRLIGMLYMLIVFAYIKFIYNDNNYDSIILYFLTLVIGRFVYFDASVESFHIAMRDALGNLPLLVLALLCTSAIAFAGFSTGYLLRSNGVVLNLFLGHLFLLLIIFIVHHTRRILKNAKRKRTRRARMAQRRKTNE